MAKIKPFKAVVYNQEKFKDITKLVCPPYDVISPLQQQQYYSLDPHNFIHIILTKEANGKDKYQMAENYFQEWLKNKAMVQEKEPAIYFYSHQYYVKGEKRIRLGFIALLHLGEKESSVYAHEHTRLEAKEDRFKLLKHVKANLSPIFAVFQDKSRIITYLHQKYSKDKKPFIDITDSEKNVHKLWRIDEPEIIESILSKMKDENIFIADGHHRFEVARAYRDEMRKKTGSSGKEEPYDYLMAYFTNNDPVGLTIFPIHRLVSLEENFDINEFLHKLNEYFYVEPFKDKRKFFFLMEKAGRTEHVLGMYWNKKQWLLRLRNVKILDKKIADKPKEYRSLDVSILNYIVLKEILSLDLEDKDLITFNPHAQELMEKVDSDTRYMAFFLNPTKMQQIISVALTGNKMPPKSTYFYPKVLSGLVVHKHEE